MGIVSAIVGIVAAAGTAIAAVGAGTAVLGAGALGTALYGGVAVLKSMAKKPDATRQSPTYQFGILQTQTNNQLPVGLIYGENKLAGNRIWQQLRENNTVIDRIVAFGEGEIESIEDVRLNDMSAKQVGATVRSYMGTGLQLVDAIVPGASQVDKIETVGSLKHLAYVAISLRANENIRSDYNLTAIVKGRKVRVYSDSENFTVQYSNNPAWCLLDFLIAYNGCAIGLNPDGTHDEAIIDEFIDVESFIESAQFCDELVNGKPRFAFNMIIDSQSSRRDIIEEFKKSCRGVLAIKGKQLQFKIDKGSSPVKTICKEDIITGSEQFWTNPREENYDRIIVKYRAQEHDWALVEAIAEKAQFDNIPPMEHSVNIFAVLEHQQASMLAWYYLNKAKLEKYFGYFETDYRAFDLEIGDSILLNENLMNFENKHVKVTKVIDKNDGTFGVFWREYNEALYQDTMGSLAPTVTRTDLENIYEEPPAPLGFSASQAFDTIQFCWDKVLGVGVTYEIREGESWELSKPVVEGIQSNSASIPLFSCGMKKYWLKSKSQHAVYSSQCAYDAIFVSEILNMNLIFHQNILQQDGGCENLYIYQNQLKPEPTSVWENYEGELWENNPDLPFCSNGLWGAKTVATSGIYESIVHDIGAVSNNIVSLNYDFYTLSEATTTSFQWAFSEDNQNWSEWLTFSDGAYRFRYFKFRINVQNPDGEQFMLSDVVVNVDVPDRDEYYSDLQIQDAQNGITIDFAQNEQSRIKQPFSIIPAVVSNISDAQPAYCVVEQKTPQLATIKAYDYQGDPVSAKIDVRVKGF